MLQKNKIILLHIIGSALFLSLPILFSPDIFETNLFKIRPFQRDFISFTLLLCFFYCNYFLFIPKFYFHKKYIVFTGFILLSYFLISILPPFILPQEHFHKTPYFSTHHPIPHLPRHNVFSGLREYLFRFLAIFTLSFMIKIYTRWKQTEKEKADAELSYLKAQINPHFLFNTLNSIYSLSIEEKANKTSNSIIQLSKMMRYVLDDSHAEFVSLVKEINYITSYIELQKIRLGNTLTLSYNTEGDFIGKKIAPIILISFIENAFKHGINPEKNSKITIQIRIDQDELYLLVANNRVQISDNAYENKGIGIYNTRNRLLLLYPNKHKINIINNSAEYKVELHIHLT